MNGGIKLSIMFEGIVSTIPHDVQFQWDALMRESVRSDPSWLGVSHFVFVNARPPHFGHRAEMNFETIKYGTNIKPIPARRIEAVFAPTTSL